MNKKYDDILKDFPPFKDIPQQKGKAKTVDWSKIKILLLKLFNNDKPNA